MTMWRAFVTTAAMAVMLFAGCATERVASSSAPASDESTDLVQSAAVQDLVDYVEGQKTTGFIVMRGGHMLVEKNWPAPNDPMLSIFLYGEASHGALLEDVASAQKSFVSILMGVAIDKGLIDVEKPVSDYIGVGWSKATSAQEAKIAVIHVLTMSSGLDDKFAYAAPAGTQFYYNTPVYAVTKRILTTVGKSSLEQLTREWLTDPAGMTETSWRERPAALGDVGNNTGLVTSPRDMARLGQMILDGGVGPGGKRVISEAGLHAMFVPSQVSPGYGRLWWLNGVGSAIRAANPDPDGRLIPAAPADLVGAFGYLQRRIYVVPSLNLVVVRTGAKAPDADFDQQLWLRLTRVIS